MMTLSGPSSRSTFGDVDEVGLFCVHAGFGLVDDGEVELGHQAVECRSRFSMIQWFMVSPATSWRVVGHLVEDGLLGFGVAVG